MSTTAIPTEERRQELALEGKEIIERLVDAMDVKKTVQEMRDLEHFQSQLMERYPWMPAAYERHKGKITRPLG